MRRALWFAPITALLFFGLGCWLGPKWLSYYFTPPVIAGAPSTFSCTPSIDWAMQELLKIQLGGVVAGLILGTALTAYLNHRAAKKGLPAPAVAGSQATPPKA
jgi:hypothetical protein